MPHVRAWKQERDVLALLQSDPLFAAFLAEEPGLREPLRAALLGAVRGGGSGEAVAGGLRLRRSTCAWTRASGVPRRSGRSGGSACW
jgi:hypothetical protein